MTSRYRKWRATCWTHPGSREVISLDTRPNRRVSEANQWCASCGSRHTCNKWCRQVKKMYEQLIKGIISLHWPFRSIFIFMQFPARILPNWHYHLWGCSPPEILDPLHLKLSKTSEKHFSRSGFTLTFIQCGFEQTFLWRWHWKRQQSRIYELKYPDFLRSGLQTNAAPRVPPSHNRYFIPLKIECSVLVKQQLEILC